MNKFLAHFFDKVPGGNIETSTTDARRKLESIKLGPDESIVSVDVKRLYTNVLVSEAIEIARRSLYSSVHAAEMSRSTLKTLLKPALTNICFKCNDKWFCHVHDLAIETSPVVTLANIGMKSLEHQIRAKKENIKKSLKMILRPALIATVESPKEENKWNVRNVRIGSIQTAKILMINFTQKWRTKFGTALIARRLTN